MLIQILLIGVSVSMDAFAVSIGKGLTVKKLRGVDAFKTALWFGGFQALFPLLGYFAASTFSKYCSHAENYKRPLYRGTKKSDALVRWTPRNGTWPPLAGKEKKPTVGGSGL